MKRIVSIALAALLMVLLTGTALATGEAARAITVVGKATVQVAPDMAVVTLGVRETYPEVLTSQGAANEKINAIVAALKEEGVESKDISTNYMSIYSEYEYDYQTGKQTFKGYTATCTLNIIVRDFDKAGLLIDKALTAGANELSGIQFTRENNKDAVDKALTLAMGDARRKAGVIAAASEVELGAMLEAREDVVYNYNDYTLNRVYASEAEADMGGGTALQGGMLDLEMTITVTYACQ
jgi:uncharacterized protein YggE